MKYPSLFAAVCMGSGVLLGRAAAQFFALVCVLAVVLGGAFFLLAIQSMRKACVGPSPILFLAAAVCILVGGSALNAQMQSLPDHRDIARVAGLGVDVSVRGRIVQVAERPFGGLEIELRVTQVGRADTLMKARGVLLISADSLRTPTHPGDQVNFSGRIQSLPEKRNPYDFDLGSYYARRGISALIRSRILEWDNIVHVHASLFSILTSLRAALRDRIHRIHSLPQARELLPAVLLGYRSDVSTDMREAFKVSGLSHLLAISGLHVGIIAWSLYWFFGQVLVRTGIHYVSLKYLRSALTLFVLLLFFLVSGGALSVQRASIMGAIILVGAALGRQTRGWNVLGLTGCLLLLINPSHLTDIGFQLSFAAVTGILLFSGRQASYRWAQTKRPAPARLVIASVGVSAAATLFTLPILLFHFGEAALGGLIINLVAIPLMTLLVYSGILSVAVGNAFFLADSTQTLAALLSCTAEISASFFAPLMISAPKGLFLPASLVPALLLAGSFSKNKRGRVWLVAASVILGAAGYVSFSNGLHVTLLDVGQGDAAVLQTPEGKIVVIDTGPGFGSGTTIRNHLSGIGAKNIDLLVLSHNHQDHTGGWARLRNSINITRTVVPTGFNQSFPDRSKNEAVPGVVSRGDTLLVDSELLIQILSPPSVARTFVGANEASLVVKVTHGSTSFLFTGDAESRAETEMVAAFGSSLQSRVVKVAHHGSSTSSTAAFLQRTEPEWAVISVGKSNRFDHPDEKIVLRWTGYSRRVLRTDQMGGITFASDGLFVQLRQP